MDPFLLTHEVSAGRYDIGPSLSPISIRDQMIRGYSLVSRAHRQNIIGPDKPLLIVGAGAAGATAALAAIDRDVNVTLVERTTSAFGLQMGCHTRYVDPTMYDWPADHWDRGRFPWAGSAVPLPWEGGVSSEVAGFWALEFQDRIEHSPLLRVLWAHELDVPSLVALSPKGPLQVRFKKTGTTGLIGPETFAMIVSCIGAGPDRVEVAAYRGKSFWRDDSYDEDNVGLPPGTAPRVLISGGGDGALQDFLRIVTSGKPAKTIYQSLPVHPVAEMAQYLESKEQQYQRAFVWSGTPKSDDCNIQTLLHEAYEDAVKRLITNHWRTLKKALEPILKGLPRLEIQVAFECSHFGHSYALNHFLALLIASYIENRHGKTVLLPKTRVVDIQPDDPRHYCNPNQSNDCQKQPHNTHAVPADCRTPRPSPDPGTGMAGNPYNVIIVRHGIDWNKPLFGSLGTANQRHLLPYYLGWG